jgi:hypothetical protein
MSNFEDFGGLTSTTGSIGGGGDGNRHDDDRGIFFPEYDDWARVNKAILKATTRAKMTLEKPLEEQITLDIDFNDGAWRPSSQVIANADFPKVGDTHPTIAGCYLDNISINHFNNQPDHFRSTLNYKYPDLDKIGSGRGDGDLDSTPMDYPFLIDFTPQVSSVLTGDDLDNKAISNINGEPYEWFSTKVRLDGVCKWNQYEWDQSDSEKWTNVINENTWEVGDYKFSKETVLLSYIVGNIRFYTNSDGQRIKYYEMSAGISVNNEGWGIGGGVVEIRRQGSFYYTQPPFNAVNELPRDKHPRDSSVGTISYDLAVDGTLATENINQPTVVTPTAVNFDQFRVYKSVNFNFVDIQQ